MTRRTRAGYRRTLGRDAEQARVLGLSWAAGDRVITIPDYPVWSWPEDRAVRRVYWSVEWGHGSPGVYTRSGIAPTERAARAAIAAAVRP